MADDTPRVAYLPDDLGDWTRSIHDNNGVDEDTDMLDLVVEYTANDGDLRVRVEYEDGTYTINASSRAQDGPEYTWESDDLDGVMHKLDFLSGLPLPTVA